MPNEGKRTYHAAAALNEQGLKKGFPDNIISAKPHDAFQPRGIAIELKRRDGRDSDVSLDQRAWLAALEACGWVTFVAFGAQAAIDWLVSLGFTDVSEGMGRWF